MMLAEKLRDLLPELKLLVNCGGGSFKSQFKKADRSGATIALILGDDEIAQGVIGVKWLREKRDQQTLKQDELVALLAAD